MAEKIVTEKTCRRCGINQPASSYHSDRANKDGLHRWCNKCNNASNAAYAKRIAGENKLIGVPRVTTKRCSACRDTKPAEAFNRLMAKKSGLSSRCKECLAANHKIKYTLNRQKHRDRINAYRATPAGRAVRQRYAARIAKDPLFERKAKDTRLKTKFGITLSEYESMLALQGGVCAICHRSSPSNRRLAVDHDHIDGKIRGLLCIRCNQALGNFEDSPEMAQRAVDYLTKHRQLRLVV